MSTHPEDPRVFSQAKILIGIGLPLSILMTLVNIDYNRFDYSLVYIRLLEELQYRRFQLQNVAIDDLLHSLVRPPASYVN